MGAVRGSLYLPSGYVLPDGATVDRADYPRLVRLADTHNLWTNDTTANAGLFGIGDGSTTMVLPNWFDRMVQMASTAGASVAAGLPNIQGEIWVTYHSSGGTASIGINGSGCMEKQSVANRPYAAPASVAYSSGGSLKMDASRSSSVYGASTTVQPPAIKQIPILRY